MSICARAAAFLMRLAFDDADVETKSDDDSDVVEVYIPTLDDGRLVVWQVEFVSDDPRFSGTMAMHWYLSRKERRYIGHDRRASRAAGDFGEGPYRGAE